MVFKEIIKKQGYNIGSYLREDITMKKMVSILLASCMLFAAVSCSGDRRSHRDDHDVRRFSPCIL